MSSNKVTVMGPNGPMKTPGFFSWRHRTNAEHKAATTAYLENRGPAARRRRATERLAAKAARA